MKTRLFITLIIFLALLLRVFKLGDIPKTLYGDEQAFAWNAYSILKYGEDEYGTAYPLQFRSFNDYKAPIPVYLLVPFIKFLGLNSFAIRLPIAVASTLIVLATFLLARLNFNRKTSLLAAYFISISPWLVHLSRGYFEATLALLFFVAGVYFVIKAKTLLNNMIVGMIFFAASIYSYFTPRILLPIFIPFLLLYVYFNNNSIRKREILKRIFISLSILFLVSLPLINATFFGHGYTRFDKLTGDTDKVVIQTVNKERYATDLPLNIRNKFHNKATVWSRFISNNYLEHLSLNFWYIYGDNSLRYFLGNMGMFYLFELPFLIIGMYSIWKDKRKTALLYLGWILLTPIPASIVGRSFAVRTIAMLPAPFLIVSYGMYKSIIWFQNRIAQIVAVILITIIVLGSFGMVLIRYYFEYPVYAATWWGWENKAALDYAKDRESEYDRIFISDYYTGAPLAYAIYNGYDPREFRNAVENPVALADDRHLIQLGKYYFGSLDIDKKRLSENIIPPKSLYIGRPAEADSGAVIKAPDDGRILFYIYTTP